MSWTVNASGSRAGTLDGRKKRAIEYQAARRHRSPRRDKASASAPLRAPPE